MHLSGVHWSNTQLTPFTLTNAKQLPRGELFWVVCIVPHHHSRTRPRQAVDPTCTGGLILTSLKALSSCNAMLKLNVDSFGGQVDSSKARLPAELCKP